MEGGRIGVIGVGSLGDPVARRLLATRHSVTVCDKAPGRMDGLARAGARTVFTAADCMDCEVILLLVATEDQVLDVVGGPGGILSALDGSALRRLAVMSTIRPEVPSRIAAMLQPTGIALVDAPVSGGGKRALDGTLTIMAAGSDDDIDGFVQVFDHLASNVFRCGQLGAGQAAKIVNNILCHANTTLTAEAFRLGLAQGLDARLMTRILETSTGRNFMTATPDGVSEAFRYQATDMLVFNAMLEILKKDLHIAEQLIAGQERHFPMITGVASLIEGLGAETYETWRKVGFDAPADGESATMTGTLEDARRSSETIGSWTD